MEKVRIVFYPPSPLHPLLLDPSNLYRDRAGNEVEQSDMPVQHGIPATNGLPVPAASSSPPPLGFVPFHPGMFPPHQYPAPAGARPDGPPYPGFVMVPTYMAHPSANGSQDAENGYMAHPQFTHPVYFPPYAQYPHPYIMRPDGQMTMSPSPYYPMYAKSPPVPRPNDVEAATGQHPGGRGGENLEGGG
jgi:hypothetical protein